MAFIIRPNGDTDLANAQIVAEGSLPQTIASLTAGTYEVGRVSWALDPIAVAAIPFESDSGTITNATNSGGDIWTFTITGHSVAAFNQTFTNIDLSSGRYVMLVAPEITDEAGDLEAGPDLLVWPKDDEGIPVRSWVDAGGTEISTANPYTKQPVDEYRDVFRRMVVTNGAGTTTVDTPALSNAYTEGAVRPVGTTYLSRVSGTTPLGANGDETLSLLSFNMPTPVGDHVLFNFTPGVTSNFGPSTRFFRLTTTVPFAVTGNLPVGMFNQRIHIVGRVTATTAKFAWWNAADGWQTLADATGTYDPINVSVQSTADLFGRSDRPLLGDIYRAAIYVGPTGTIPDPMTTDTRQRIMTGENLMAPQAFADLLGSGAETRLLLEGAAGAAAWNAGLAGSAPYLNGDGSAWAVTGSFVDV